MIFVTSTRFVTNNPLIDVMVDLETNGKRPGCGILSIGATAFDKRGPFDGSHQQLSLRNQFLATIDSASCDAIGLKEEAETMVWWNEPAQAEARKEAFGGDTPIREALEAFIAWTKEFAILDRDGVPQVALWSHGEDFDQGILQCAIERCDLIRNWPYNGGRDTRTILEAGDVAYKGVAHRALEDAMHQTLAVRRAWSNLRINKGFQPHLPVAA